MDPLTEISTRQAPQSRQADARQERNAAGGYGFVLDEFARVRRFLTLGTDGGTYYTSARDLTADNARIVLKLAETDSLRLVDEIVAVSTGGWAPRQNPALFALAATTALAGDVGRKAALDALPRVARIGTHLFLFARYVEQFRGWGRGLRRAVASWYLDKPVEDVAYQVVKYRQREGWSHRDLLRLAHPADGDPVRKALFDWVCGREAAVGDGSLRVVEGFQKAQAASTVAQWKALVEQYPLSWEMLPDQALTEPDVWRSLVEKGMPQTALMRQLPRLTRLGVVGRWSSLTRTVAAQLADTRRLRKARVHPVNVLVALRTYASGHGARGGGEWKPVGKIVDALDAAFYEAFGSIEPAGKRTLVALDVSGSMTSPVSGMPLTCREASAALGLVTMATEPQTEVVGFTSGGSDFWDAGLTELSISPRQRLDDSIAAVSGLPFGGTDCSLPMTWASKTRQEIDTFLVITDNETWAGKIHPHQALRQYRERMGIDARLAVLGMTANQVSIADPADAGMLDVAGFDSAAPRLVADFSRGDV